MQENKQKPVAEFIGYISGEMPVIKWLGDKVPAGTQFYAMPTPVLDRAPVIAARPTADQQAAGSVDTPEFRELLQERCFAFQHGPKARIDAAHAALVRHLDSRAQPVATNFKAQFTEYAQWCAATKRTPMPYSAFSACAQPVAAGELPPLPTPTHIERSGNYFSDWQMRAYGQQCADSRPAGGATDEQLCPACRGSGEGMMMEGAGPDAYEVPCNCAHCGGSGDLLDAYNGVAKLLAEAERKYLDACGQLYFAKPAATLAASVAQPDDVARLEFLMEREAWIAWGKDGERCRVFHRNEDGDSVPFLGWGHENAWQENPRYAIDDAMRHVAPTTEGAEHE